MRRDEIHQRALLAAAKATLSVAALGCGNASEPATAPPRAPTVGVRAAPAPTGAQAGWTAVPAKREPTDGAPVSCLSGSPGPYSKAQISCCAEVVLSMPSATPYPRPQLSTEQTQCCQLIVSESDAGREPGAESGMRPVDAYRCCGYGAPMPRGPTCSPWGPPMPPEMDLALLDEERQV